MAGYIPPKKISSGRTVKRNEEFRLHMLDAANDEHRRRFTATREQSDVLYYYMSEGADRGLVRDEFEKWSLLYADTKQIQDEVKRLLPKDEIEYRSQTFYQQMSTFDGLRKDIAQYLNQPTTGARPRGSKKQVREEYDSLVDETKKLEEEIKNMAMGLSTYRENKSIDEWKQILVDNPPPSNTKASSSAALPQTTAAVPPVKATKVLIDAPPRPPRSVPVQDQPPTPIKHQKVSFPNPVTYPYHTKYDDFWSVKQEAFEKPSYVPQRFSVPYSPPPDSTYTPEPPPSSRRQRKMIHSAPFVDEVPTEKPAVDVMDILERLTTAISENSIRDKLPQKEPPVFDGDLLRFPAWLHAFESLVETKRNSESECAYYLGVYTSGKAKSAIQGILDSKVPEAYSRAKSILISRFGDTFRITEAYKNRLHAWPFVRKGDGEALTAFSDFLWQCHNSMSLFGNLLPLDSPDENTKIAKKLPYNLAERWARNVNKWAQMYKMGVATGTAENLTPFPPFVEFCCFVTEEAQVATGPINFQRKDDQQSVHPARRKQAVFTSSTAVGPVRDPIPNLEGADKRRSFGPPAPQQCLHCLKSHHVSKCDAFLKLDPDKRREIARMGGVCYGCLKRGHLYYECTNRNPALLLHHTKATTAATHVKVGSNNLQSMILPVVVYHIENPYFKQTTYLVLDNQSDCCMVKHNFAKSLQLDRYMEPVDLELTTASGTRVERSSLMYGLIVRAIDGGHEIALPRCYTKEFIPASRDRIPCPESVATWPHLEKVRRELPDIYPDMDIGILVGYNCSEAMFPLQHVTGGFDEPFATKTLLGWGVTGASSSQPMGDPREVSAKNTVCLAAQSERISIDMKRIFDTDFADAYDEEKISVEDRNFLRQMDEGLVHLDNGHVQLPLPLKDLDRKVPSNRPMAFRRLMNLKKRFNDDEDFHEQFSKGIQKMIEKGYAEKVPAGNLKRDDGKLLYLPIQGVWHAKKIRDLRIVHDGGAIYLGFCLNDLLLTGPDLLNNLNAVLIRFRERIFAFTCDIEGMFMQVMVTPADRDMLRFLWFQDGDITKPIEEYRMTAHIFGASSSPGVTNYALCSIAKKKRHKYGDEVSDFIIRHFYVDDGLKSLDTRKETIELMQGSHDMCEEGGFNLHKYLCNDAQALEAIPEKLRASGVKDLSVLSDETKQPVERTLGMSWQYIRDMFVFLANLVKKPLTRRGLLSSSSSIFDPLGLLCPILVVGKLLLQGLCLGGYSWDEVVMPDLQQQWNVWHNDLEFLKSIEIPRCIQNRNDNVKFDLHFFADASLKAYGYCAYVRALAPDGTITSNLLTAKAKVMPSKAMTVPRLELQAATLASRAYRFLKKEMSLPLESTTFWTDSSIVLHYIKNDNKRFQMFVANRVGQIQDLTEGCAWKHIETEENPADILSRGSTSWDLRRNDKWWHGPKRLKESWCLPDVPIPGSLPETDPEIRKKKTVLQTIAKVTHPSIFETLKRLSTWRKLIRCVAIWRRYMDNLRRMIKKEKIVLSYPDNLNINVEELTKAENVLVIIMQLEAFPEVIYKLKKTYPDTRQTAKARKSSLKPKTNLYKLDIYIGADGVMRVGGRIRRSNVPRELSNPKIFPKDHFLTKLMIQHHHVNVLHAGRGITMNSIRVHGYWVLQGRTAVSKMITKCVVCRILRGPTITQQMAELPPERVEQSPPFTVVGVDVCGPYTIKSGRVDKKRWICAFTCFSTRAFHMEVLHSMTTDSFIHAYRRFVNRRGPARLIKCDQGTNFVGASREIKEAFKEMDEYKINQELAKDYCDFISFSFNSPKASHMGGVWERMFRTARQGMNYLLTQHSNKLDDELFLTLVTEIESVINSRPLTCVDMVDADSPEPLSPAQILTFKHKITMPLPGKFVEQDIYCRKRWRKIQYMAKQFWIRWNKEFLPTLQERRKWQDKVFELEVGDMVLLVDENAPRNHWIKGIVEISIPSHDGQVRRATIRTCHGRYERPVHKLIFLFRDEVQSPSREPS